MPEQSILTFDFGTQKIGVAYGQTLTGSARPVECLKALAGKPDWNVIKNLINKWQPDHIGVGLPLNLDGSQSTLSEQARKFARRLSHQLHRTILLIDERLSSKDAAQLMPDKHRPSKSKNKKRHAQNLDAWAAVVIAQTWINERLDARHTFEEIKPYLRHTEQASTPPTCED